MKMEFEEWWKESEGPRPLKSDLSLNTLAVVELAKKLCRQAFEAGREYEKQKKTIPWKSARLKNERKKNSV